MLFWAIISISKKRPARDLTTSKSHCRYQNSSWDHCSKCKNHLSRRKLTKHGHWPPISPLPQQKKKRELQLNDIGYSTRITFFKDIPFAWKQKEFCTIYYARYITSELLEEHTSAKGGLIKKQL